MRQRTARKGPHAGQQFWGCSSLPGLQRHALSVTTAPVQNPSEPVGLVRPVSLLRTTSQSQAVLALLRHHHFQRLVALVRRVFLRLDAAAWLVGVSSEAGWRSVTASLALWNLTLTILLTPCSCMVMP